MILPGGIKVDQPATHRIFAGIGDGIGADIAVRLEPRDQLVAIDALTRF